VGLAVAAVTVASIATAQPAGDTAKFQPAIQEVRACLHSQVPAAYTSVDATRPSEVFEFLKAHCYPRYEAKITALGAGDAAFGSFRGIAREEWGAFLDSIGR
jgi:hypothetical protein